MANPFHIDQMIKDMATVKRQLPILLANQAQRHFVASFQEQGYEGKQWKEVQRRTEGTKAYKYPMHKGLSRRTSPILVRSGNMRRGVNNSIRSATWALVKLVTAFHYASYQNEGTASIEARPFMKDTVKLRAMQTELITKTTNRIFHI